MFDKIKEFEDFPQSVKNGLVFLFISWGWCFLTLYLYLYDPPEQIPYRQVLSGIAICISILTIKNWARMLSILCNVMIIIQFSPVFFTDVMNDNITRGLVIGLNMILFTLACYYMFIKSTADFFKANSQKWSYDPSSGEDVKKTKESK